MLYKDVYAKEHSQSRSISISASVLGTGGGIGLSRSDTEDFFDIGIELEEMLENVKKKGKKIIIGIDEVSKTEAMIQFTAEFGKWVRADLPVYLICTGLYDNIEQLYNVKNLTFFRRATTIKTEPLNEIRMTEMYKSRLGLDSSKAGYFAKLTKGYPYAFLELGILLFKGKSTETEELIDTLKTELFAYSYEKIWEELSEEDRGLLRLLTDKPEYKRDEIISRMNKPSNYSVYRDRLLKRGIIKSRHSYISLALPYFNEYVKEYCMAEWR